MTVSVTTKVVLLCVVVVDLQQLVMVVVDPLQLVVMVVGKL